jgi:ankyrin repeat protein
MKKIILIITAVFLIMAAPIYYYNQIYARKIAAAIWDRDIAKLEKLVKQKGNINSTQSIIDWSRLIEKGNEPPIIYACLSGNFEIVKLLVENGAKVDVIIKFQKNDPISPLRTALEGLTFAYPTDERLMITEYLFDNGVDLVRLQQKDPDIADILFYRIIVTPLPPENELVEYKIFLKFIEQGIVLNENDTVYWEGNFLHMAARYNNLLITKYLIEELHYNINAIGRDRQTAIVKAAKRNSTEMVKYLIEKGADQTIRDNDNKSAKDYAAANDNAEMINLLD